MKAYVIAQIKVEDPEVYSQYTAQTPATIAAHGGKFIARAGQADVLEGETSNYRTVILEFPSREAVNNWFHSPEYQAIKHLRAASSSGSLIVVDAVEDGFAPSANVVKTS